MSDFAHRGPLGQKPPKPDRRAPAGFAHMARVKLLPCIACGAPPPSDAHHCTGGGMRRDNLKVIPLCLACHRGPQGYHARKRAWVARHGPDYDFLPRVAEMLLGLV